MVAAVSLIDREHARPASPRGYPVLVLHFGALTP